MMNHIPTVEKFFFIVLVIMLYSCSPASDDTIPKDLEGIENLTVYSETESPPFQIELQEVTRIDDSNDVILGRITGIYTDEEDRIFISDDGEKRINVYSPAGEFIQSLGRSGQGPGEFEFVHNLVVDESYVYAMDFSQNFINTYDLETLEFDSTIPMLREDQRNEKLRSYFPSDFQVLSDGDLLIKYTKSFGRNDDESEKRYDYLYRTDRTGSLSTQPVLELASAEAIVLRTANSVSVFGAPFAVSLNTALSPSQKIVVNRTDRFLFKMYDTNGNYERAFYYPFPNKPLTRDTALNQYDNENYRRAIRNFDLPETWPAVDQFMIDDKNRFWVSTIIDEEDMFEWWVLDEQGNLLAKQTWPSSRTIEHIHNNYLYMTEEDEMGLVEVVKYRLSLN